MKRKIAYGAVMMITLLAGVLTSAEFAYFLLVFEVLFAAAMAVWVRIMASRLQISVHLLQKTVLQGEHAKMELRIKNPTIFPMGRMEAKLAVRDLSGWQMAKNGAQKIIPVSVGADGRSTDCWQMEIAPVHCGLLGIELAEVYAFDFIGLCKVRLKGPFTARYISVLPRIYALDAGEELRQACSSKRGQEEVAARPGSDTQEIFDTRFYRRGDTLHTVHWKLSAKSDDLMVREFSMPIDTAVRFAVDCESDGKAGKITMEQMDRVLEMAASFAAYCLEQSNSCELLWYSAADETLHASRIENESELYTAMEELLGLHPYTNPADAKPKSKASEKTATKTSGKTSEKTAAKTSGKASEKTAVTHPHIADMLAEDADELFLIGLDGFVYRAGQRLGIELLKEENKKN